MNFETLQLENALREIVEEMKAKIYNEPAKSAVFIKNI
jgi:hypothetical protein